MQHVPCCQMSLAKYWFSITSIVGKLNNQTIFFVSVLVENIIHQVVDFVKHFAICAVIILHFIFGIIMLNISVIDVCVKIFEEIIYELCRYQAVINLKPKSLLVYIYTFFHKQYFYSFCIIIIIKY